MLIGMFRIWDPTSYSYHNDPSDRREMGEQQRCTRRSAIVPHVRKQGHHDAMVVSLGGREFTKIVLIGTTPLFHERLRWVEEQRLDGKTFVRERGDDTDRWLVTVVLHRASFHHRFSLCRTYVRGQQRGDYRYLPIRTECHRGCVATLPAIMVAPTTTIPVYTAPF